MIVAQTNEQVDDLVVGCPRVLADARPRRGSAG